jgi:hypothetical protein
MKEDLLKEDFTENVDIKKIDKSILLSKIVLLMNSLYYLLELFGWLKYFIVGIPNDEVKNQSHNQIVFWFIVIPLAITFYISWIWFIKGNRLLKDSIQNNEYRNFNLGYDFINKSTIASLISTFISLIDSFLLNH